MALKEAMDGPVVDTNEASAYAPLELFGALLESQKSILVEFRNSLLVMPEVTFFFTIPTLVSETQTNKSYFYLF
jgi:hypothetical protein